MGHYLDKLFGVLHEIGSWLFLILMGGYLVVCTLLVIVGTVASIKVLVWPNRKTEEKELLQERVLAVVFLVLLTIAAFLSSIGYWGHF